MKLLILVCLALSAPATAAARTSVGIDVLRERDFQALEGANVGLITNHTGVSEDGVSTVDLMLQSDRFRLVCIFSPEHGFAGKLEHGQNVADSVDEKSRVRIYSLYGAANRPTEEMLKGVDTLVFDIQDVGTRFYTYITTMGMALEEASKRKLRFVVLDRPNPIRGDVMDGDVLDPDVKRMTGYFQIPVRHGLTVGEIAHWMNKARGLNANLTVVPMRNWKRKLWFDQTGLKFLAPSPNIPGLTAAFLYSGIGCFEATNLSVGRGTPTPFEVFGAPWIDGKALCAALRARNMPGVLFEPVTFIPSKDIYKGEECGGVRVIVTNRNRARPFLVFIHAFLFLRQAYPGDFEPDWEEVRVVTGSNALRDAVEGRLPLGSLLARYEEAIRNFRRAIAPFLLY